ncbi:MAG TPA: four helix bundle protein [Candidatus Paceibacterota bacterium]
MYAKSYKELIVWQKSIQLVKAVYTITAQMPKSELYGLVSQMCRAAVSIPSNIAEGYKRKSRLEFLQFLSIAEGSAAELETQLIISKELYPQIECYIAEQLLEEVQKILVIFIRKLNAKR